ncbi:MAG: serine hydrolase, partial [Campylobacterales bacterium]
SEITRTDFLKSNLKKTSFPTTNGFSNEFARGYYERYKDGVLYDYTIQSPSSTWAAGGAISTPLELLAWAEVFGEGHLLDKTTQKEQLEYVDMGEGAKYGLGMLIQDDGTIGHNGTVFGYQTQMFYKDGISIVIYTNSYYQSKDNPTFTTYKDVASIIF